MERHHDAGVGQGLQAGGGVGPVDADLRPVEVGTGIEVVGVDAHHAAQCLHPPRLLGRGDAEVLEGEAVVESRLRLLQRVEGIDSGLVAGIAVGVHVNVEVLLPPRLHVGHEVRQLIEHEEPVIAIRMDIAWVLHLHAEAEEAIVGEEFDALEHEPVVAGVVQLLRLGGGVAAVGFREGLPVHHHDEALVGGRIVEGGLQHLVLQRDVDQPERQLRHGRHARLLSEVGQVLGVLQGGFRRHQRTDRRGEHILGGAFAEELPVKLAVRAESDAREFCGDVLGEAPLLHGRGIDEDEVLGGVPHEDRLVGGDFVELGLVEIAAHGHHIKAEGEYVGLRVLRGGHVFRELGEGRLPCLHAWKGRSVGIGRGEVAQRRARQRGAADDGMGMGLDEARIDDAAFELPVDLVGILVEPGLEVI